MKLKRVLTAMVILMMGVLLSGCACTKIKHLSGEDFIRQAQQISQLNSAHWTHYIGCSPDRAYLEFGYPAFIGKGARTTIYWTGLSELPEEMALTLKAGNPPWKPWQAEADKAEVKKED